MSDPRFKAGDRVWFFDETLMTVRVFQIDKVETAPDGKSKYFEKSSFCWADEKALYLHLPAKLF